MPPSTPPVQTYDARTIVLHWLTAALIAFQWCWAQVIDLFPRGALRVDARSVHIVVGVMLTVILAYRLVWRISAGRRLPPAGQGVLQRTATAAHWLLYGLVVAMLGAGFVLTWVRGDSLFNLISIAPLFGPNRALSHTVGEVHEALGLAIILLAGVHAAAALVHHFIWRDGLLNRMRLTQ